MKKLLLLLLIGVVCLFLFSSVTMADEKINPALPNPGEQNAKVLPNPKFNGSWAGELKRPGNTIGNDSILNISAKDAETLKIFFSIPGRGKEDVEGKVWKNDMNLIRFEQKSGSVMVLRLEGDQIQADYKPFGNPSMSGIFFRQ
jgi:hypothetical protein